MKSSPRPVKKKRDRYANIEWAKMTDKEVADQLGMTRGGVSAARKRLGAAPSPAGWGGYRTGVHTTIWYRRLVRNISRRLMHGQLEELLKAVVAEKRKSPGGAPAATRQRAYFGGLHLTDWYREQIKELLLGLEHGQLEKLVKLARSYRKKTAA